MTELLSVHPATCLLGSVPVPVDAQVLLPKVALAVLSRGMSSFQLREVPESVRVFLAGCQVVGVHSETTAEGLQVQGLGLSQDALKATHEVQLDVRGEPQAAALLLAVLAGRRFACRLIVDAVVADAFKGILEELGLGTCETRELATILLPRRESRVPAFSLSCRGLFSWIKEALLLLALRADGPSEVIEDVLSSDSLERSLFRVRAPLTVHGTWIQVHPPRDEDALGPHTWQCPGSFEMAAYLGAMAMSIPGSRVTVRSVSMSPSRGFAMRTFAELGPRVSLEPRGDMSGEPVADVTFYAGVIRRAQYEEDQVAPLLDLVLPLTLALAAGSEVAELRGAFPLSGGADGRLLGRALGLLRSAGIQVESNGGQFKVYPSASLRPLVVTTGGDPRLCLLALGIALRSRGESRIDDVGCLRQLFPRAIGTLRALGAPIELTTGPAI